MPRLLAGLAVLTFALPAIIVALWWTALVTQFFRRVPAVDAWETTISVRRVSMVGLAVLLITGWAAIGWAWYQYAPPYLDTFGLRSLADWAVATLQNG